MVATLVAKLQVCTPLAVICFFVLVAMLRKMVTRMQDANMRTNKDTSDVLLALAANKSVGCATGAFAIPLYVCMLACLPVPHTHAPQLLISCSSP
jgi:hypothetical protein